MYPKPPSPSLRNLPLGRLTLFDMIDVVVKYSISRLSMDSGIVTWGRGEGYIGVISGLSTRGRMKEWRLSTLSLFSSFAFNHDM